MDDINCHSPGYAINGGSSALRISYWLSLLFLDWSYVVRDRQSSLWTAVRSLVSTVSLRNTCRLQHQRTSKLTRRTIDWILARTSLWKSHSTLMPFTSMIRSPCCRPATNYDQNRNQELGNTGTTRKLSNEQLCRAAVEQWLQWNYLLIISPAACAGECCSISPMYCPGRSFNVCTVKPYPSKFGQRTTWQSLSLNSFSILVCWLLSAPFCIACWFHSSLSTETNKTPVNVPHNQLQKLSISLYHEIVQAR